MGSSDLRVAARGGHLADALRLDVHYRELIPGEADFDPLRHDPDFQALVSIAV